MSDETAYEFKLIPTGVPNFDVVLGGGLPVGSFNLIAGGPGTGKTILSQQIMYHLSRRFAGAKGRKSKSKASNAPCAWHCFLTLEGVTGNADQGLRSP